MPIFKLLRVSLCAVLAVSLVLGPTAAFAQSPDPNASDEGKSHFNSAVTLFREGDYRGALAEFHRAYELTRNYRVLYNIGQTEYELQDYAGALRSFERYLADGGAEVEAERRAAVRADIKKLSLRIAKLDVQSNVAGADILVDDVVVGRTPLSQPLIVSAGRRKITVQKADLAPANRVIELTGGDSSSITLDLTTPQSEQHKSTLAEPHAPAPAPSRTAMWISLAATGVLAGGAVVTGLFALDAHDDAESKLKSRGVTAGDVESAHTRASNLALATDVLGGAAIGMGILSVVFALQGGREASPRSHASLTAGPAGVGVRGQF